jgi:hypothetical protein
VDDPGRWMRLDPLDKIREEGEDAPTTAEGEGADAPTLRLETVYGRCSKRERPSIRKSEKQDSMM